MDENNMKGEIDIVLAP